MKNTFIILISLILLSCTKTKYKHIGQEIVEGKVSATQEAIVKFCRNCEPEKPAIWVQNSTNTVKVTLPFEYGRKWKVGDSCLLIIEKYEVDNGK